MKNEILKKVDEAIETIKPIVEDRMPFRKWKMHINLFWDNSFSVLFEYTEDLSEADGNKTVEKYELSNQFWYSDTQPDIIEYSLIRFTGEDQEVLKKEEIPIKGGSFTSNKEDKKSKKEETPPLEGDAYNDQLDDYTDIFWNTLYRRVSASDSSQAAP